MAARIDVTTSDLRRLLEIVDPARAGEEGQHVPFSLLQDIGDLVPCDCVAFQVLDLIRQTGELQGADPSEVGPDLDAEHQALWWPAFWESCSYPQRSGDYSTVIRESDVLPGVSEGPRWAAFAEACGRGPMHGVMLSLPPAGPVDRRVLLWRESGSDFSDREVMILTLLRPHIIALYRRHRALNDGVPALTSRQREVLQLAATGRTNRQIARALVLSEATVGKHLENIFTRLQVSNRTEAIAKFHETLQPV